MGLLGKEYKRVCSRQTAVPSYEQVPNALITAVCCVLCAVVEYSRCGICSSIVSVRYYCGCGAEVILSIIPVCRFFWSTLNLKNYLFLRSVVVSEGSSLLRRESIHYYILVVSNEEYHNNHLISSFKRKAKANLHTTETYLSSDAARLYATVMSIRQVTIPFCPTDPSRFYSSCPRIWSLPGD